ncbi:MAG: OmpA family protein [Saprospiraceae bacterium]
MKLYSICVCILFSLSTTAALSQTYTTEETTSRKAQKLYKEARALNIAEQYPKALAVVEKSIAADPNLIDAALLKAAIYYNLDRYADAVQAYEKALAMAPPAYSPGAWYQLALSAWKLEDFEAAAKHFESYLKLETKSSPTLNRAKQYLKNARFIAEAIKTPVPFEPTPLAGAVNTINNESLPVFTADGSMLVYTFMSGGREDLYVSRLVDSVWQAGEPIEAVNTPQNEGAQAISVDGKLLIFTGCNRMGAMGSCDLYFSEWRNGAWTEPKNMGAPINTGAWESQPSLSADGRTVYFASERAGGKGGRDLWISQRQKSGRWGDPVNLGDSLNTTANEASPFIHPDGQTLYFMSDGHPGMGGYDLFFSRKTAAGTWSKPKNLGYPINTMANEGALVVSLDGQTAYFSGDKTDGAGGVDLYSFPLYSAAQPLAVTYAKANVFDEQTKKPLPGALVVVTDLQTGQPYTAANTDEKGEFLVCLPSGKPYAMNVSLPDYLFYSEHFELAGLTHAGKPFLLNIALSAIPAGTAVTSSNKPVTLRNVFFESGSAQLKPESKTELERLKQLLNDHKTLNIQINGHTDNVGPDADNLRLSEQRAKAVYDYLVQNGIATARLRFKGFGETQTVASNETPEGRQQNRRTEFVVVGK